MMIRVLRLIQRYVFYAYENIGYLELTFVCLQARENAHTILTHSARHIVLCKERC